MNDDRNRQYANDAEIAALVGRFESCELPPAQISHRLHVAMSAWCFLTLPAPEAAARVYDGLRRYVKHHNINIYNETITQFWIKLIGKAAANSDANRPAFEMVNNLVERFGDSRMIFAFYTRARLQTDKARNGWIEPDLQPLD